MGDGGIERLQEPDFSSPVEEPFSWGVLVVVSLLMAFESRGLSEEKTKTGTCFGIELRYVQSQVCSSLASAWYV